MDLVLYVRQNFRQFRSDKTNRVDRQQRYHQHPTGKEKGNRKRTPQVLHEQDPAQVAPPQQLHDEQGPMVLD
jgi:hypothetical protein